MLKFLRIKNLAIIEDLELELGSGLNILTGETGAGKSIIIDGIKLILGERAESDLIRTGEKKALIEAIIDIDKNQYIKAEFPELPWEEENEIILRREIHSAGKGRITFNGSPIPLSILKKFGEEILDIYGQNDHIFLLDLNFHLQFLDLYGKNLNLKNEVSNLWHELKRLEKEMELIEKTERERIQRLDFLEYQIKEIESANLKLDEDKELGRERNILANAEKIYQISQEAVELSYSSETSIISQLKSLKKKIGELTHYEERFLEEIKNLEEISTKLDEFSRFLINFNEKVEVNPAKLEKIEERLHQIEKLKKKWGSTIEEILKSLKNAKIEKENLMKFEEKQDLLKREIDDKKDIYINKSSLLSEKRKEALKKLEEEVEKAISLLGMEKAKFIVNFITKDLSEIKSGENGLDEVEFFISPNVGEDPRPLRKIASGGELSRIMLALKSLGKEMEESKTLIFDEIDSGIGGKVAEIVGERLKKLANFNQVICVTHLPQIASFAENHFRIEKKIERGRTLTEVEKLGRKERIKEIARLMVGSNITELSLKNAEEMIRKNSSFL
ncbi:MAG: DNA repair protein RecN [Acidobacteriota bacterium]